jgi:hypothetical protein
VALHDLLQILNGRDSIVVISCLQFGSMIAWSSGLTRRTVEFLNFGLLLMGHSLLSVQGSLSAGYGLPGGGLGRGFLFELEEQLDLVIELSHCPLELADQHLDLILAVPRHLYAFSDLGTQSLMTVNSG